MKPPRKSTKSTNIINYLINEIKGLIIRNQHLQRHLTISNHQDNPKQKHIGGTNYC